MTDTISVVETMKKSEVFVIVVHMFNRQDKTSLSGNWNSCRCGNGRSCNFVKL